MQASIGRDEHLTDQVPWLKGEIVLAFQAKVKENALVASGRHCSICHKFCGTKIEIHHVLPKADGGADTNENAIPLCFDCHADMRSYDHNHPKGTKYSEKELIRHRDNWYLKVSGNFGIANREEIIETDKIIYRLLVEILPWNGSITFIKNNSFAGFSFNTEALQDLNRYMEQCLNPAFEFIDPDLEGLRVELTEHISLFMDGIGHDTFPTDTITRNSVPKEWEYQQPDRFARVVNQLHNSADSICKTYESIVKTATRKLGVLPESMT